MRKITLLKNAVILTITSFILRSFGMIIRSYMSNKIGAEGMGLYQLIISIYVLATTFVTAGISTAVIRLVTDAYAKRVSNKKIKNIMIKSIAISLILSFIVIGIFFILAKPISIYWLKDERCILSIKVLVLVLPFISISSCIKGYFMARREVFFNSVSQLFEQVVRIVCIYIFLEFSINTSLEKVCMLIILSDIISEIVACIFVYLKYAKEMRGIKGNDYKGFKLSEFFKIAFPIAVNRYVTSILRTVENILIPNKIEQYTMSRELSLSQFGYLKGMALPLIFFPASFLTALSTLLMPEATEASSLNQKSKITKLVEKTFQFTLASAILIACIFFLYSNEIGYIFYKNEEIGFYIKFLAPLIPFMYIESAIAGMMQGLDQQKETLKYNVIDSIIRIGLIWIAVPFFGMKGFLVIMYVSNIMTSGSNSLRLLKVSNTKFKLNLWVIKPLLSAIASYIFCMFVCTYLVFANLVIEILFKICVISGTYIVILSLFGIISIRRDSQVFKIRHSQRQF